jgi:hypothetical protein
MNKVSKLTSNEIADILESSDAGIIIENKKIGIKY